MNNGDSDYIILSPHLDDAVLSCGGDIFRRTSAGQRVVVITIMAGDPPAGELSPYAGSLQSRWALLKEAAAARRAEDQAAVDLLGAEWVQWEIPDCIYRRHPTTGQTMYNSDEEIFGEIDPGEKFLIEQLTGQLRALTLLESTELAVPLGIGHHVDHQITRAAAERLNRPLIYYEDYPYAQIPGELEKIISPQSSKWRSRTIPLTAAQLERKIAAIRLYRSQLSTFFATERDLIDQVTSYSTAVGGERVWLHQKHP